VRYQVARVELDSADVGQASPDRGAIDASQKQVPFPIATPGVIVMIKECDDASTN
jgi:hypothetical protein